MCLISGLPGVCATLTVVTDLTSSPRTSTAGSGQPTRPGWRPQTAGPPSTTGQPPEGEKILRQKKYVRKYLSLCANISDSVPAPSPSPTTGSRPSWAESPSRAWLCSTTFTAMVRRWWSKEGTFLMDCVSGIKWHDVACHHEKPIICEDVEGHLAFARQTFPNIRIPWMERTPSNINLFISLFIYVVS